MRKLSILFILADLKLGYCVGLGNIWRFPYLVRESGGACFLIPYFIMLFLVGIPLLYMELSLGILTQRGPVQSFKALCPLLKGKIIFFLIEEFCKEIEESQNNFNLRNRLRYDSTCIFVRRIFYNYHFLLPSLPVSIGDWLWSTLGQVPKWSWNLGHRILSRYSEWNIFESICCCDTGKLSVIFLKAILLKFKINVQIWLFDTLQKPKVLSRPYQII